MKNVAVLGGAFDPVHKDNIETEKKLDVAYREGDVWRRGNEKRIRQGKVVSDCPCCG